MTEEQIIKAFECCENNCDCLGCPKLDDTKGCNGVAAEILDLITRQKEQIEALIAGQETLQKYIAEKDAEIERLKNSRDRWKRNALDFDEASRETEKELERLYEMVGDAE